MHSSKYLFSLNISHRSLMSTPICHAGPSRLLTSQSLHPIVDACLDPDERFLEIFLRSDEFMCLVIRCGEKIFSKKFVESEMHRLKEGFNILEQPENLAKAAPRIARMLNCSVHSNDAYEFIDVCLNFFYNHPEEALDSASLEYFASTLEHCAANVQDYFNPIFTFLTSTPVIFQRKEMLESLATALVGSACWAVRTGSNHRCDPEKAREQFRQIKYYVTFSKLMFNPTFQTELKTHVDCEKNRIKYESEDKDSLEERSRKIVLLTPFLCANASG